LLISPTGVTIYLHFTPDLYYRYRPLAVVRFNWRSCVQFTSTRNISAASFYILVRKTVTFPFTETYLASLKFLLRS